MPAGGKSYKKPLGTLSGSDKRSKATHKPRGSGFGRADIGPGSKMQNKHRKRPSRGIGY